MKRYLDYLRDVPFPVYLCSFSALDLYFRNKSLSTIHVIAETNLVEIAKTFPNIAYPGLESVDAVVHIDDVRIHIRCVDSLSAAGPYPFTVQNLFYDISDEKYIDRYSVYRDLRSPELRLLAPSPAQSWQPIIDAAVLVSRYGYTLGEDDFSFQGSVTSLLREGAQRELLGAILTGDAPKRGLNILLDYGFVELHWPELFHMRDVSHSKEHHPEGDVWDHTVETFRYRKTNDLVLALGLLLHDIGKPWSQKKNGRKFDKHAQIGSRITEQFLHRLAFEQEVIEQVKFLVTEHMLPAYITTLRSGRIEEIMASPLFPLLLEMYRCDLSSTFRGPDGYYKACKTYRTYLKNSRNPFRSADGKKIIRLYVDK